MIRKSRKSALEHYQVNAGGEYIYTGKYLKYQEEGKSRRRALLELWGLTGAMTACVIACGCIPAPGTQNTFYVLLPLMVEIILSCSCLWSLGQITAGGEPMKEYVYQDSVPKLPGRLTATAIFGGAVFLLELLYLVLNGGFGWPMALVLLLELLAVVLAMAAKKGISRMKWAEKV